MLGFSHGVVSCPGQQGALLVIRRGSWRCFRCDTGLPCVSRDSPSVRPGRDVGWLQWRYAVVQVCEAAVCSPRRGAVVPESRRRRFLSPGEQRQTGSERSPEPRGARGCYGR